MNLDLRPRSRADGTARRLDRHGHQIVLFLRHQGVGHGDVTLADALCRSCNVYFYAAARRMGPQTLVDWARQFGIGQPTGIDLPYKILSSDVWVASRLLADRYAAGRVFLTGDACHLHPPFGGYGMNMGIADSVDLGWKISAVLRGWGGPALLESYEIERRPAHQYVMDEAEANHAMSPNSLAREGIEDSTAYGAAIRDAAAAMIWLNKPAEFYSLGVVLGYRYSNSPIIAADPNESEWQPARDYVPCGAPGCLAPHRWLEDGTSIYDLFGRDFTLLVFDSAAAGEASAARREAEHTGTPLKIVSLFDASLVRLYGAPLVLIRPDQHVAWRGCAWPEGGVLSLVSGRVTHRVRKARDATVS